MDMSMSGMDMGMGASSEAMSGGSISIDWIPQVYWIFVGSLIAAFSAVNLLDYILFRQRISAANRGHPFPARPNNLLWRTYATLSAVSRELSNAALPSIRFGRFTLQSPSLGVVAIVVGHLVLVTVLCLMGFDLSNIINWQYVGYRTGIVSMAQLPLIFLLAGRNNIIGMLTGMSYERLNWLHRWTARSLLFTSTLHMGYWFASWAPYGDYISYMATNDRTTIEGIVAWSIMAWLVFSSFAPIRGWNYEIFVLQHTISYIALIVGIYMHTPPATHGWIWGPVAIYFLDKLTRAAYSVYINLAIFHPQRQRSQQGEKQLWACQATLTALPDNITRVSIANPPLTWQPGQHAFLSAHTIAPLQSHPFTISSLPSDGKLEFLIKAHRGGTKRFFAHAQKAQLTLPSLHDPVPSGGKTTSVAIEGAYGRMRPLRQFDSVVLFAASTGAAFTMPLLRDIVRQWRNTTSSSQSRSSLLSAPDVAATRHIRFVWVVKSRAQLRWFSEQLNQAMKDVQELCQQGKDVELEASVYVTCDESLTSDYNTSVFHSASNTTAPPQIEEKSAPSYTSDSASDNSDASIIKKKVVIGGDVVAVREIDPRSDLSSTTSHADNTTKNDIKTCGKDNTCCCQSTIRDESAADAILPASAVCNCNCSHNNTSSSSSSISSSTAEKEQRFLHPGIMLLSGRPHPRSIVRKSLEQATGESAVVVCGTKGLNADVRSAVVALSDERAVHKGTGALGVWFWSEGFGW